MLLKAFSMPILVHEWQDSKTLNAALKKVILQKEKEEDGMKRSNARSCWHSDCDLLSWDNPAISDFHDRVRTLSSQMIGGLGADPKQYVFKANAWAMVSRDKDYGFPHTHPNCVFSGVYYVSTGKPHKGPNNGVLEFLDPRQFNCTVEGLPLQEKRIIKPVPGLGVMFRSDMVHMVHPFYGDGERVAIAYNISVVKKNGKTSSNR